MKFQIKQAKVTHFIDPEEIIYCRADRSYCTLFFDKKEIVYSKPLANLSRLLNPMVFIRIHNSFLINLCLVEKQIRSNDQLHVLMSTGVKLPVARSKRALFQEAMNHFLTQ